VSTENPVIMLIFLTYSLVLCWGNISNSNVTMEFAQLHYFLSQNIGEDKIYYVPPCPKVGCLWLQSQCALAAVPNKTGLKNGSQTFYRRVSHHNTAKFVVVYSEWACDELKDVSLPPLMCRLHVSKPF